MQIEMYNDSVDIPFRKTKNKYRKTKNKYVPFCMRIPEKYSFFFYGGFHISLVRI